MRQERKRRRSPRYTKEEWKEILDYFLTWQIEQFGRTYDKGTELGDDVWRMYKRHFDINKL